MIEPRHAADPVSYKAGLNKRGAAPELSEVSSVHAAAATRTCAAICQAACSLTPFFSLAISRMQKRGRQLRLVIEPCDEGAALTDHIIAGRSPTRRPL